MPHLRCTAKLLKLTGPDFQRTARADTSKEDEADWYVNLLWIDRRKCLLFTNVGTLFPVVVLDVRKADALNLEGVLRDTLIDVLRNLGATEAQVARALLMLGPMQIGRSSNRRVLGSMNDYAFLTESYVERAGGTTRANSIRVSCEVGEAPMSVIDYSSGIREFLGRCSGNRA